jgi:hypothetical protein
MRRTLIVIALTALAFIPSAQAQQPIWGPTVEADNGQQYQLANIAHLKSGMAWALLYTWRAPGEGSLPDRVLFDCRGHMQFEGDYITPMSYIPPRSVAGRLAELSCTKIKGEKLIAD